MASNERYEVVQKNSWMRLTYLLTDKFFPSLTAYLGKKTAVAELRLPDLYTFV